MTDQPQQPSDQPEGRTPPEAQTAPGGSTPSGSMPPPPAQGSPGSMPPAGHGPPAGQQPPPPPGAYGPPQGTPPGGVPPQTYQSAGVSPMSPQDEKMWATLTHLSPLVASFVGMPFLGPLVIYLILKDRGPFIRHHAAQALNFQIIVFLALVVSSILIFAIVGLVLLPVVGIAAVVFVIIAAVAANRGEWYRYPLTPDWVK